MILLRDITKLLTLKGAAKKNAKHIQDADLSIEVKKSILIDKNRIQWVGDLKNLPSFYRKKITKEISLKNKMVMPSLIECHTHAVFSGSRSDEFEMRNQGMSYQEIAAKGGGILSTQKALGQTSEKILLAVTQKRVNQFIRQGVSVVEVKSGYGLDLQNEVKSLSVLKKIKKAQIVPTFLGAHAIPLNFPNEVAYLNYLKSQVIPVIQKKQLAKRVDIFIEKGFFSKTAAKDYLQFCHDLGFQTVIHADQLSSSGGTELACELNSLSADHVIHLSESEIKKVATSKVTCVLLPLADLYMKCAYPPAQKLIQAGARVALATDFNPGSCPSQDVMMVGLLARLEMKMTLTQVIVAYTLGASYALNLQNDFGSIEVGKIANLNVLSGNLEDLFYSSTNNPIKERFYNSKLEKLNSAVFLQDL